MSMCGVISEPKPVNAYSGNNGRAVILLGDFIPLLPPVPGDGSEIMAISITASDEHTRPMGAGRSADFYLHPASGANAPSFLSWLQYIQPFQSGRDSKHGRKCRNRIREFETSYALPSLQTCTGCPLLASTPKLTSRNALFLPGRRLDCNIWSEDHRSLPLRSRSVRMEIGESELDLDSRSQTMRIT
jgi:hypothetical protein